MKNSQLYFSNKFEPFVSWLLGSYRLNYVLFPSTLSQLRVAKHLCTIYASKSSSKVTFEGPGELSPFYSKVITFPPFSMDTGGIVYIATVP